ncbi:MAG: hypothetical protein CME57_07910 [Halieaceae bacterium]|nr:hypothetical protein [Halieaceae bacterium]
MAKASRNKATGKGKKTSQPLSPISAKLSKAQLLELLAADSGLRKAEIKLVLGALDRVIEASMGPKGGGQFTMPGLLKMATVPLPAVKARKGINPFTREETWFKAKPARTQVKIRPLKKLKGFAN